MHTNGIVKAFVDQQAEILTSRVLRKARQQAADVSASLTRRGAAQAQADLLNEAVNKLIGYLYERDTDNYPCNIDRSGKILIALPWGSVGRPMYGLRRTQGDTLRRYVQHLAGLRRPVPLFRYDDESTRWFLNWEDYPTAAAALAYWDVVAVNAAAWRRFSVQSAS